MTERVTKVLVRRRPTQRSVEQPVTLGGVRLVVRTRYSAQDGRWRLWLLDPAGGAIVGPLTLVPGVDLLLGHKHDPRVPQGQLFVYSSDRTPPDATSVDVTAQLFYRDA